MVGVPVPIATKRTASAAIINCPTATIVIAASTTSLTIVIGTSVVSTRSVKRSLGIPWVVRKVRCVLRILHRIDVDELEILFPQSMLSGATIHWNAYMVPPVPKLFKIKIWDQIPCVYRKANLPGDDCTPCILGIDFGSLRFFVLRRSANAQGGGGGKGRIITHQFPRLLCIKIRVNIPQGYQRSYALNLLKISLFCIGVLGLQFYSYNMPLKGVICYGN